MTMLDAPFIENARKSPVEFEHGIHVVYFSKSDETAGEGMFASSAVLKVTMDEQVVGYITSNVNGANGAVSAAGFGTAAPVPFHTLEGALEQMLPGVADGLAEKPEL
jgi:hypothetical protein